MDPLSGEYPLTQLERVVFGAGSIARLGDEVERLGASRAVVVTGRTLGASPLLAQVTGALGARCVHVFTGARQHVPAAAVAGLAQALDAHRADCVVSFGGGSPIDAAKAAVHRLLEAAAPQAGRGLPHVAVPTTLSAGEFTAVAGDHRRGHAREARDRRPAARPEGRGARPRAERRHAAVAVGRVRHASVRSRG